MFRTHIDSFSTITEANQGEDRAVRSEFEMKVYGYLIPDTINKDLASLKKSYSKVQIKLGSESVINDLSFININQ